MTRLLPFADPTDPGNWPSTLREALDRVLSVMDPDERRKIAAMPEHLVDSLNVDLGAYIRKSCGLWRGNADLMASCETLNPEDTSLVVVRALWAELRRRP